MNVREMAELYGVSGAFVVRALHQVGFHDAMPDTSLPAPVVALFESRWGERIRAQRPKPPAPPPTAQSRAAPTAVPKARRQLPHVMRVAHARVTAGRDKSGHRELRLMPNPGLVHALDAIGTRDGDPWSGRIVPGAVHFFRGPMNSGPRAACGQLHMRALLGDEFVPAADAERAGQCQTCAEVVTVGRGFREPPGYYDPFCYAFLHINVDGSVEVQQCSLSGSHRGLHRTKDGATWDVGFADFTPAPLDAARHITKPS